MGYTIRNTDQKSESAAGDNVVNIHPFYQKINTDKNY